MHKKPLLCDIKMYDQTSNFIPVNIAKDAVKLVTQNLLGSSGPGSTDSEYLQVWLLKFGENRKRLCTSVETFLTG